MAVCLEISQRLPRDYKPFDETEVESTILARLANVVRENAHRPAIKGSGLSITYTQLDAMSNELAHEIVRKIGDGSEPIALLYRAGVDHCIAQFGVLKAGKFFASLDFELGAERLTPIVRDLNVRLILCAKGLAVLAREVAAAVPGCAVVETSSDSLDGTNNPPACTLTPHSNAYVVYTSGSTGRPEGVLMTHRTLLHLVMNHTETTRLNCNDRALHVCPLSSAGSAGEIFSTLLNGATLYPFWLKARGGAELAQFIDDEQITVCSFVPVVFRVLLSSLAKNRVLSHVRLIRLTGDRTLLKDCQRFCEHFSRHCLLRISLGASEALLYTQYYVHHDAMPATEIAPAGYPMRGMEVFIVDEHRNRLGPNQTGEICVKSKYLSPGYWMNDDLTAQRFVDAGDGSRVYFTRDIGYLNSDGCLIHLGRSDSRVKIYGKFVTLTDIEACMLRVEGVAQAAVVARSSATRESHLVAFYVSDDRQCASLESIRRALKERFPIEILPRSIHRLAALPITERNKIDRRRLVLELDQFASAALAH